MLMRSFACNPSGWGELQNFTTRKVLKAPIFDEDFNLILKSRPQHNHFQIQTIISINTKETEIGDRLDGWCSDLLFVDAVWVFHTHALKLLWHLLSNRSLKLGNCLETRHISFISNSMFVFNFWQNMSNCIHPFCTSVLVYLCFLFCVYFPLLFINTVHLIPYLQLIQVNEQCWDCVCVAWGHGLDPQPLHKASLFPPSFSPLLPPQNSLSSLTQPPHIALCAPQMGPHSGL